MTIDKLINNIKAINIADVLQNTFTATRQQLINYQRAQMLSGKRSTGDVIGKYKNERYAVLKFQQNPLAGLGNKDLKLTGVFQSDVFVDIRDNSLVFGSADEKTQRIVEREGETIFGLNNESIAQYIKTDFAPIATNNIIKQIHR